MERSLLTGEVLPTNHGPLTVHALQGLLTVAKAAETGAKVSWLADDGANVLQGTARSLGHEDSTFLGWDEDIRDGFLRITATSGFDYYLPVVKVAEMAGRGEFILDR